MQVSHVRRMKSHSLTSQKQSHQLSAAHFSVFSNVESLPLLPLSVFHNPAFFVATFCMLLAYQRP